MLRKTNEQFIQEVNEKNKYVEPLDEYKSIHSKIRFKCTICGHIWFAEPNNILQGSKCPLCFGKNKRTNEEFLSEIKQINPNITFLEKYDGLDKKIMCRCTRCGHEWAALPHNLLNGNGCPRCAKSQTSFIEQLIFFYFRKLIGDKDVCNRDRQAIGKELDIYIPSYHLAIEYGSWYWHHRNIHYDNLKKDLCRQSGIRLIIIYDSYKGQIVDDSDDLFIFDYNLADEKGLQTIKGLLVDISSDYPFHVSLSDRQWKELITCAKENSYGKNNEEFTLALKRINPNITPLEKYLGSQTKIKCRCNECGHEWSVTPNNLIKGSGCPKCAFANRRKSNTEFIESLSATHPEIELLEEYTDSRIKIKCRCKKCGYRWSALPNALLIGQGCPQCSNYVRKTDSEFKEDLLSINPNIELRSIYINSYTKLKCKCKKCGHEWFSSPSSLLNGQKCPECSMNDKNAEFIHKLALINKDIEPIGRFVGSHEKILCRCKLCGREWNAIAKNLLNGAKCSCLKSKITTKTNDEFVKEIIDRHLDVIPLEDYRNSKTKILFKCNACGNEWRTTPNIILGGHICPVCANKHRKDKKTKTNDEFISELRIKNPQCYPLESYKGDSIKIKCKCKQCGNIWCVTPNNLLHGYGCPKCGKQTAAKSRNKAVICCETNMVYESINDAAKSLSISPSCISGCIHGRIETAGGFHWKLV